MNPSAIYSKSGKGVQEASGKTSLLKRQDRAVLSAIDGRATLGEVAQKVGKSFDGEFEKLIRQLDKDGFVREVTAGGAASPSKPAPAAKAPSPKAPAAKPPPAAASGGGEDLDFTSIMPAIKPGTPRPAPKATPPPTPTPKPAPASPAAEQRAKEQESALYKARQEAEARAQADRDRGRLEIEAKARAEAEAKIRAETEKKLREEGENKVKAEAEAKAKAARDLTMRLTAEAKAKGQAAAQAKIDAERKAREEGEGKAREEAEKARKEADELRQRLEEERKGREAEEERRRKEEEERRAREETERKAREEADLKRREEEEQRRRQEEEERRAREEAERKAREETERKRLEEEERRRKDEEQRREREEIERMAREAGEAKRREEEDRRLREKEEQARRVREEDEAKTRREEEARALKARAEEEERARKELDETQARIPTLDFGALSQEVKAAAGKEPGAAKERAPEPPAAKPAGPGSLDSLMADLDSFSQREEDERKTREEADRKSKEEKRRRVQEEADRRAKEEAERERREAEDRRRKEEEARRAREEEERRQREEEERLRAESEERKRRQHEAMAAAQATESTTGTPAREQGGRQAPLDDIAITPQDLDMDDVKQDEAVVAKDARKAQREKERETRQREKEARDRANAQERERDAEPVKYSRPRRRVKWGKPVAITLFVLLLAGVGYVHVMPLPLPDYEQAASAALGRPVRISSGRLSLFTGVTLNLDGVRIGDGVRIARVRAFPAIGSLFDEKKVFNRIELDGVTLPQEALGETLFAKATGENFRVNRIVVKELKLDGPLPLPTLEADAVVGPDGGFRTVTLRGPESLVAKLTPGPGSVEFDATATSLTLPFAPEVHLKSFAMKGTATRQGLSIASWGGSVLDGALSGTANVRWGGTWQVDGVVQVRNINAAVFAPALLSEGKADVPAGRFSFSGADPARLSNNARLEGNFVVQRGVLGSFDLSRAIRTGGREFAGRTQFLEMTGQGVYDRGAVQMRNITVSAGALNAGATLDVAPGGPLNGRIVADIKTSAGHAMRATLILGGTVKEPQVRN